MNPPGLAVLLSVTVLMPTAAAQADTVAIPVPPEAVFGTESPITVDVTTSGPRELNVIRRPLEGTPPCAGTPDADEKAAGQEGQRAVTSRTVETGRHEVQVLWSGGGKPGVWRLCAWLQENPSRATTAATESRASVRAPKGTIAFTKVRQHRTFIDAGVLETLYGVTVSGTRERDAFVSGAWRVAGPCPKKPGEGKISFLGQRRASAGAFRFSGETTGPLLTLGRRYVLCAYVYAVGLDDPIAVARRVVEPRTKPVYEVAPQVGSNTVPVRRLTCSRGRGAWAAYPRRIVFAYRWYRSGRRLSSSKSSIAVGSRDRGKSFACEVIARNSVGTTTKRSRSYRIY